MGRGRGVGVVHTRDGGKQVDSQGEQTMCVHGWVPKVASGRVCDTIV